MAADGSAPRLLAGRVALVTGASSGLGAHFARTLATAGARVVLGARRAASLEAVRDGILADGGEAIAVPVDVTDEATLVAACDAAEASFGPVDTVVANAGLNHEGDALALSAADFDEVMAVNVKGTFLTVREGARRMIAAGAAEREHGRIIVVGSMMGHSVLSGMAAYCASKAAVEHMTRALGREWARRGISINAICPGYIPTELTADWFGTPPGHKLVSSWPRRRLLEPEDLDATLLHLASDAARRVTGSIFTIDDGQSL